MSGFDKNWLALREPVDRAARSETVAGEFVSFLESADVPNTVLDIGSGTGSTYRTLSTRLSPDTRWRLVDYDAVLLEEARRRINPSALVEFHQQDLNDFDDRLLDRVSAVTASALFDLCSAEFCAAFVKTLARNGNALYAALNYNGTMEWTISHPLDEEVVKDFNQHQVSNKGFGPALGPKATDYLVETCKANGFECFTGDSPWRMDGGTRELQSAFLNGLRTPLKEVGRLSDKDFEGWLDFRLSHIGVESSICTVGHTDLLSLPRR
ncbi:class I SAM-dependent methyltransferase [Agrobacterium larrymoorei]|uniref:class I SAM-dependent methyltransferase n=1 Tax=Agrobacterium larrymoorei TaxID=160699 RepID=UPI0015723FC8|nr:class I SAM-dependent methyltransferase [Agrobacterium larrymoorei]NTJ43924.1 class I SAM-dependent methyltransferase [Agrobacterium larrymoorei]